MKKFFKILNICILSLVVLVYLAFLIAPSFVNLDFLKPQIQQITKDTSKLNLDYSKLKIYTTPLLSVGVVLEDLNITFDDNTSLFKTDKIKTGISLPSLLTLTLKTAQTQIENPNINLEVVDNKQYKIALIVEEIINENIKKPKIEKPKTEQEIKNEQILSWVTNHTRIKVPCVKITNYKVDINNPKTKNKLLLSGEELKLGYISKSNTIKLKSILHLYSNENQNILADLDIKTFIPKSVPTQKEEIDPDETIEIPFIDIINIYQTYDLKTNVTSKLRIKNSKNKGVLAFGYFNVDDLTLKLSNIQLPKSHFHSKFNGERITYDSNIYVKSDEKLDVAGFVQIGKYPRLKTVLMSDDIHFSNMLALLEGLLDSLNIKNSIPFIKANGYLNANAMIDTDFKNLTSNGKIIVKDGSFINEKTNIGIKNIVANLVFDNDSIDIKNAQAEINNSKVNLSGNIDNKSNADIKLAVNNLSLPILYNAFAPKELKNAYKLNSLNLSVNANIKGKLDDLNAVMSAKLDNLSLNDYKRTMFVTNKTTVFDLNGNKENINAKLTNSAFNFNIPSSNIFTNISTLAINIDKNKITINPFDFIYNKNSKFNIKGEIQNYLKDLNLDLFVDGLVSTNDIKKTLGNEISYYLKSSGNIPLKVSIKGDKKSQNILAQIYSTPNNFITPIDLKVLYGANTLIQGDIKIKGNKIHIKNSGLFKANQKFSNDLVLNQQNKKELVEFSTILENNHVNLLRINIPNELKGNISIMKKSSFKAKGKLIANGEINSLNFLGNLKISDIKIPELKLAVKNLGINMLAKTLSLNADDVDLNGSKINASLKTSTMPSKIIHISDIKVNSDFIDVDKAMVVSNEAMKYIPQASTTTKNTKNTKQSSSNTIPLSADGKFSIKKITTGQIVLNDTVGNLKLHDNDLIIEKLKTKAFDGSMKGKITMNLLTSLLTIKMQGENIDSNTMLLQSANMKDMISGILKFNANISLKGATYIEQIKSLKGTVDFSIKDGQYGPFAKLENFFLAENIRENPVFKATIGTILTPILTIDSTHFEELKGVLSFKDGKVNLIPITSRGDILCILIKGDMDLLNNILDTKVRVRLASTVSDMLGPLTLANPINLVKNTPGLNIATAKLFTFFTQVVAENEYKEIPDFSAKHSDKNATKFQIVLSGDVNKPLKLVKSFKWLALQDDMDKAKEFSDKYVKEQEDLARQQLMNKLQEKYEADNKVKVGVQKVLQMDTTAPEVKQMLVDEIIKTKEETANKIQTKIDDKVDSISTKTQEKVQNSIIKVQNNIESKKQETLNKLQSKVQQKLPQNTTESEENKVEDIQ